MSGIMINDNLHMNNINPFWNEPPGAWSRPYKYTPTVQNTMEQEPELLNGGDPRGVEYRCKLDRPLYPKRNIDNGFWSMCKKTAENVKNGSVETPVFPVMIALIIMLLIISNLE